MADSKPPEGNAPQLSLPELARRGADLVASLPDHVCKSYESDDASERVRQLEAITGRLLVGTAPVVVWLELNIPDAAKDLKRRLMRTCNEVKASVTQEIPEYRDGKRREYITSTPSEGLQQARKAAGGVTHLEYFIQKIADKIESEESSARAASAVEAKVDRVEKDLGRVKKKATRPKSPREKKREQRLKFIKPRFEKGCSWELIAEQYRKRYPKDRKVNSASMRLMWNRAQEKK